jgi:hypothetical protein
VKGVLDLKEEVLSAKCSESSGNLKRKETVGQENPEKDSEPEAEITQL